MELVRTRKGTRVEVSALEAGLLGTLAADLMVLLDDGVAAEEPATPPDPLAVLVGLPGKDPARPDDPALIRLLPDAYGDDPAASSDFRRYTDGELRAGKRAHAQGLLASLAAVTPDGGTTLLDRDQADHWLIAINDLRLVLGARLEITDDDDNDPDLDEDDARAQAWAVYHWLGTTQELLLRAIAPRGTH